MGKRTAKAVGKIVKQVAEHTPEPIKDKAKAYVAEKTKEKITEHFQDKGKELTEKLGNATDGLADKVHDRAGEAEEKTQGVLLSAREKLGNVVEAGKELQEKITGAHEEKDKNRHAGSIKGIRDIKTSKDIKGAAKIKGATKIKSIKDIKTIGS